MPEQTDPLCQGPVPPAVPIVAVFGSDNGLDLAYAMGYEIGKANCVLLTGGFGPSGAKVKNSALAGADSAANSLGVLAPWIGVPKGTDKPQANPDPERCYQLETGLGDERNYLEALLCDVAVAIAGREGTKSEAAFCIALGRPIALLGDWSTILTPQLENGVTELRSAIQERVLARPNISPDLRALIIAANNALTPEKLEAARNPEADAEEAASWAKTAANRNHQRVLPALEQTRPELKACLDWVAGLQIDPDPTAVPTGRVPQPRPDGPSTSSNRHPPGLAAGSDPGSGEGPRS